MIHVFKHIEGEITMKKILVILFMMLLMCTGIVGCAGNSAPANEPDTDAPENPASTNAVPDSGTATLAQIRKAAEDAGYTVADGHNLVFMKDVADGFTVQFVADGQDTVYSIVECKTEEAAIANAKDIDDAGHSIALRSGKILTCYGADVKDGTAKEVLKSILAGKPLPKE
jgi:hypothetical protein